MLLVVATGLIGPAGCGPRDDIAVYTAPTESHTATAREPVKLIALLVSVSDQDQWVFKLSGPDESVDAVSSTVMDFFHSLRVNPKQSGEPPPITWKLPDGWREREGSGEFRYASIAIPTRGGSLDLSVSHFEQKLRLLDNVNRWRKQILRNPIREAELDFVSRPFDVSNAVAVLCEMRGHKLAKTR
jgi:hypothetical protein